MVQKSSSDDKSLKFLNVAGSACLSCMMMMYFGYKQKNGMGASTSSTSSTSPTSHTSPSDMTESNDPSGTAVSAVDGNKTSPEVATDVRLLISFEDEVDASGIEVINHHEKLVDDGCEIIQRFHTHVVYGNPKKNTVAYKVVRGEILQYFKEKRILRNPFYKMQKMHVRIAVILGEFGYGPKILSKSDDNMFMEQNRYDDVRNPSREDLDRFDEIIWSIASMGLFWTDCIYQNFKRDRESGNIVIVDFTIEYVAVIQSANPYALYYHMWRILNDNMPYYQQKYHLFIADFIEEVTEMRCASSIKTDSRFSDIYTRYKWWFGDNAAMNDVRPKHDSIRIPQVNTNFTTVFKTEILKVPSSM
jgi:hypothetical protein